MKEFRTSNLRAAVPAGESNLILEGIPIVFNTPTKINDVFGSYTEIIRNGALDAADLSDIRLLYNHDLTKVPLARTPKTMRFNLDPVGLKMTAELPITEEGKSIYTAVQRGDLSGMSFAFKVPPGGDNFDAKSNTRTINKIEKVYEFSITPFPAYPQTSIEARTAIQGIWDKQKNIQQLKIKVNQILKRSV
ncbi:HK97 family phage prohead protease [Clostridium sp.]|uniref:HK97 family phage prohead protease n=1 Tax=Clostridium sp. TaxID=1506 RepID=UPI002FDE139F